MGDETQHAASRQTAEKIARIIRTAAAATEGKKLKEFTTDEH
jgi:hypothetical protein